MGSGKDSVIGGQGTLPLAPLAAALKPSDPWLPDVQHWEPLAGGRSNLVWRVPLKSGHAVVKLYRSQAASGLFPNDAAAEAEALHRLAGQALAPDLIGLRHTALGDCVIYHHLPGRDWSGHGCPGPDDETALRDIAGMLRRVHGLRPWPGLRQQAGGSAALRGLIAQDGGSALLPLLAGLPEVAPVSAGLLHGDPVAGNVILGPGGARLIDWQCPAVGDPCHDLALLLSPGMHLLYRGIAPDPAMVRMLQEAYWQGNRPGATRYRALAPYLHARVAGYFLTRAAAGSAADAAAATLEIDALKASLPQAFRS